MTYRAAYWTDGQSDLVLTHPEQSHLSDDALIAEAERELVGQGGIIGDGRIVVGEWRP